MITLKSSLLALELDDDPYYEENGSGDADIPNEEDPFIPNPDLETPDDNPYYDDPDEDDDDY